MRPIVEEMTQCAITYDRLGQCIASDLDIKWSSSTPSDAPTQLTDAAEQIYKELRLFFNKANRTRMLDWTANPMRTGEDAKLDVNQVAREINESVLAMHAGDISVEPSDIADIPDKVQLEVNQVVATVGAGGVLRGIHIHEIAPVPFRAAEVVLLSGNVVVANCEEGTIEGITIDVLPNSRGVRAELNLVIDNVKGARVIGISANRMPNAIEQLADGTVVAD